MEFLSNLYNSLQGEDLKDYKVVIELDIGTHAGNGNNFLFVKDADADGKIIDMAQRHIEAQRSDGGVPFRTIDQLKNLADGSHAEKSAVIGADAIMNNYATYSAGSYAKLPFDKENPDTATGEDLSQIKTALENIRADLYSGIAPIQKYNTDGDFDGLEVSGNFNNIMNRIKRVDEALFNVGAALGAGAVLESIKEALPESDLTFSQKDNINYELSESSNTGSSPTLSSVKP